MALAPLQKLLLFARPHDLPPLVDVLQACGVLHLVPGEAFLPDDARPAFGSLSDEGGLAGRRQALERRLQGLDAAIETLDRCVPRRGLAARLAPPREQASLQDFMALAAYDEAPVVQQLAALAAAARDFDARLARTRDLMARLGLLTGTVVPLEHLRDTERCFVRVLRLERRAWAALPAHLDTWTGGAHAVAVLADGSDHVVAYVVARHAHLGALLAWLDAAPTQAAVLDVAGLDGTAADNVARLRREAAALAQERAALDAQRCALAVHLPQLRAASDYWSTRLEQLRKQELLRASRYTAVVGGWVRARDVEHLRATLAGRGLDAVVETEAPGPDDDPPVEYENTDLVRPFEYISDLYSRPRYRERDPSPYLAGFFALFFGICLTDVGYGLVLAAGTAWALRHVPSLSPAGRKIVRILFYSGLVTVVVGALTGGYFGVAAEALPGPLRALRHLVVLDPIEDQMLFLGIALALGMVQVALGIFLKLSWRLQHGEGAAAWLDQAPWLALVAAGAAFGGAQVTGAVWLTQAGYGLLAAAAFVLLFFAGRAAAHPAKRLAVGVFTLYQVSGLLGDVLSYARLFALGIATGVIAGVVNFVAGLTLGIPYVGVVLVPLVLVFGHAFNLGINALGGFIHTTRLQFVEFFGKFHEGGGVAFDAFQLKTKYTQVLDLP